MLGRDLLASTAILAAALLLGSQPSAAQSQFPAKPVEIIVPFAAGGSTDLGARALAQALQERWRVSVKVVNKPGGNTVPAVDEVMRAQPDGYTVLMDGSPSSSLLAVAVPDFAHKIADRTFITMTSQTAMIIVVPANSPFKSLSDVVGGLKNDPKSFTWTSLGGTGTIDMTFRQLFKLAGVNIADTRAVVSRGGSEAATQTAGGHVMVGAGSYSSVSPFLSSGKLRALAIAAPQRSRIATNIATTREVGFPSVQVVQWNGFSGPPKMPREVIERWHATMQDVLSDPATVQTLARIGLEPYLADGAEMTRVVEAETKVLLDLFKRQ